MSNRRQVTVLYSENKLQKTISLPASATIATAKKIGSDEILQHLRLQPGVPSDISLDDDCIDFYPAASDNTRVRDLNGQATIVVWPKAAPGSSFTPAPIMDALSSATAELEELRAQRSAEALIKEDKQPKKKQKNKPESSSIRPPDTADEDGSMLAKILSRLTVSETKIAALEHSDADLRERLTIAEKSSAALQEKIDSDAIDDMRLRILVNMGRDKLAVVFGHKNWQEWRASAGSREELYNSALTRLKEDPTGVPPQWANIGDNPSALRTMLFPKRPVQPGDFVVRASTSDSEEPADDP
ncbi:hypothetical protein PILCRDRAFT_83388 [Piloderma croceum F 1598]|uniref:Uncharacterized protein n=1 Tax=Piloderma croceum (strain F 1598) TaxID=765440 RepID=A0A0C3BZT9_PILCF|nr:hypothetical protein PILCRDRAFT_83388 [Piloderma croceum F 1598]